MSDDTKAEFGEADTAPKSADRQPVWSDDGDAPFDMGDDPEALESEKPITAPRRRKKAKPVTEKKSAANETVEIVKTIFFALLIALVVRVLLLQPFTIPSASMEPNLYEGDYIVVSKWSYGYSKHSIPFSPPLFEDRIMGRDPKRGDVVVFKLPSNTKIDYIKRVIGVPGDKIQMRGGQLFLNDAPVENTVVSSAEVSALFRPATLSQVRETLPGGRSYMTQDYGPNNELDNTPVFEVPAGYFFMMGDNRDNSIDSRADVGLVPHENLVGKAQIILFSWSPGASLANPITWFANLRPSRFFQKLD